MPAPAAFPPPPPPRFGLPECPPSPEYETIPVCAACGKQDNHLNRCGQCKQVFYCDVKCQQAHWSAGHKAECPVLRDRLLRAAQNTEADVPEPLYDPSFDELGVEVRECFSLPHGAVLCVSAGSVVDFSGDVVVNAANRGCQGGGGVDGAITKMGGPELREARSALPVINEDGDRCETGDAVLTTGGRLKADWCVHAVGPAYFEEMRERRRTEEDCDELVASAYRNSLKRAKEARAESVGFSLLSAGIFRGNRSLEDVLRAGVRGVRAGAYPGLRQVHLVAFMEAERRTLLEVARAELGE